MCYKEAKAILEENIDILHKCASILLEKERIARPEFEALFVKEQTDAAQNGETTADA